MSKLYCLSLFAILTFSASTEGTPLQKKQSESGSGNSRVVVTSTLPSATPSPQPSVVPEQAAPSRPVPSRTSVPSNDRFKPSLSFSQLKAKVAEAKRLMQTRPLTTASVDPAVFISTIRVAYYDRTTGKIEYVAMNKDVFLQPNTLTHLISSNGRPIYSRTIRGNGVNTPIELTDERGDRHLPLLVQYPRETRGVFTEMAYYVSTHPGIVTPEVVNAGMFYVRNTIDIARSALRSKGFSIQPKVADIAERLSTVEHVDHLRFRTEYHPNIYNDIFTLYAMNEGDTYRYAVSSAGAGGMVQMIPSTYRIVRSRFPNAGLMPDFVDGMRNHVNAAQAMLLYMQMTWNDLISRPVVLDALQTGLATQEQLMAAGYNSNPAKLPGYITRGGADWATLIPRETKIYLQIYDSLERFVPMAPRKQ